MKAISTEYFLSLRIEFSLLIRMCSTLAWIRHRVNKNLPDYDQQVFPVFRSSRDSFKLSRENAISNFINVPPSLALIMIIPYSDLQKQTKYFKVGRSP